MKYQNFTTHCRVRDGRRIPYLRKTRDSKRDVTTTTKGGGGWRSRKGEGEESS